MAKHNLKDFPLFQNVSAQFIAELENAAVEKTVTAGDTLFHRDDEGTEAFIVTDGVIRIERITDDGKRMLINILGPGEIFGEMALITGRARMADAVAHTDCVLLSIHSPRFRELIANHTMSERIMNVLSKRLAESGARMEGFGLASLKSRLADVILDFADRFGTKHSDHTVIDIKLNQSDLAELVAGSREHVNKTLQVWKSDGVLDFEKGIIRIFKPDLLRTMK